MLKFWMKLNDGEDYQIFFPRRWLKLKVVDLA